VAPILDIIFLALTGLFFVVGAAYVTTCRRLEKRKP